MKKTLLIMLLTVLTTTATYMGMNQIGLNSNPKTVDVTMTVHKDQKLVPAWQNVKTIAK